MAQMAHTFGSGYKMGLTKTSAASTRGMIRRYYDAGLPEPEFTLIDGFVTTIERPGGQVTGQVGTKSGLGQAQDKAHDEAQDKAQVILTPIEIKLLQACTATPRNSQDLLEVAGYSSRAGNFKRSIEKLLQNGFLEMTIPDKPTSRHQKYRLTTEGLALLKGLGEIGG